MCRTRSSDWRSSTPNGLVASGTMAKILRQAGEGRPQAVLLEDSDWSSYGQLRRLLEATSAVDAVVGDLDGVLDVAVADHAHHGPENLVLGGRVAVIGHVEDGRLEIESSLGLSGSSAASENGGSGVDGQFDVPFAFGPLRGGDDRSDLGGRISGFADGEARRDRGDAGRRFGLVGLGHDDPGRQHAALPGVGEEHAQTTLGGSVDRVGQVDPGGLAASMARSTPAISQVSTSATTSSVAGSITVSAGPAEPSTNAPST
jgi:hypothetical protein